MVCLHAFLPSGLQTGHNVGEWHWLLQHAASLLLILRKTDKSKLWGLIYIIIKENPEMSANKGTDDRSIPSGFWNLLLLQLLPLHSTWSCLNERELDCRSEAAVIWLVDAFFSTDINQQTVVKRIRRIVFNHCLSLSCHPGEPCRR